MVGRSECTRARVCTESVFSNALRTRSGWCALFQSLLTMNTSLRCRAPLPKTEAYTSPTAASLPSVVSSATSSATHARGSAPARAPTSASAGSSRPRTHGRAVNVAVAGLERGPDRGGHVGAVGLPLCGRKRGGRRGGARVLVRCGAGRCGAGRGGAVRGGEGAAPLAVHVPKPTAGISLPEASRNAVRSAMLRCSVTIAARVQGHVARSQRASTGT